MYLKNIYLENFRNYEKQNIEFINGINFFVGDNAQGKTNIIESIYICAFGKSYRTLKDNEIINFKKEYSKIELNYIKNDSENKVNVYIDKNGKKIINQNEVKINKISDIIGNIPFVIFSPDSLDIVKGSPQKRRQFIDVVCSQISKKYLINLQEYNKYLKLKNNILKNENIDIEYLKIINEKLSEYIFEIVNYRKNIINKLLQKAKIIHFEITNNSEIIDLEYMTDFLEKSKEEIYNYLNSYLNIEIIRKMSLKGIQRDDLIIKINGLEVSKFGSQGQNRTALLTLKLSDFEIIKDIKEENPILLLDDIMSELDSNRINYLLKYIEKYQSIITTTDYNFIKNVTNIKIYKVLNGTLEN